MLKNQKQATEKIRTTKMPFLNVIPEKKNKEDIAEK
jgi:hypothetical protein